MERLYSIFSFVILYSILILALEVDIMESWIIQKEKRSYEVCSNTISTLKTNVKNCPNGREEQLERSRNAQCNITCHGQPCVYHCVQSVEGIVEVCAPVETLIGRHCPIYDEGIGRVREDFLTVCTKCPFVSYSNDPLNSECRVSNCTKNARLSKRAAKCRESSPTTTESSSRASTRPSEDDKFLSGSEEEINPFWNRYVIAGVMLFICMVLLSVGMFLHIRRKKALRKTQRKAEGQLICQKKCNPNLASSSLLQIEGVY
uniref:Uncharacterized protein LOC111101163 isoform X2 n=1 Tax=Crassostrea virginica TaxID=6565 RepID=A0A8B8ADI8_CRAVI|nr:uncharacterized protein LOC111101163 isoform X2 [Crassostrea virginica]